MNESDTARPGHGRPGEPVTAIQAAMLPAAVPVLPCLDVAGRYLLGPSEGSAGGDWFDALPLRDGRVALVVGDVVGHGVEAAATMGRLQAVLHERLSAGVDGAAAVESLDSFASRIAEARGSTVCVVVVDPLTGTLEHLSAGHPPPLVVNREGGFRYLHPPCGQPLATGAEFRAETDTLGEDEMLLLFTDGLLQRPGCETAESTVELAQVSSTVLAHGGIAGKEPLNDSACRRILQLLVRKTGYADDISVLTAMRARREAPPDLSLPAEPTSIRTARSYLTAWLDDLYVRDLDKVALLHGASEIVANAVRHAYPAADTEGGITVRSRLDEDGTASVEVSDRGHWHEPETGGRGLAMAGGLVDEMLVDRRGQGTTVRLRHRLGRPALMLRSLHGVEEAKPGATRTEEPRVDSRPGHVEVEGPLDWDNIEELNSALLEASGAGASETTVDLSAATHLASCAVQTLFEAAERNAGQGTRLTLVAPSGSAAQQVLELVGLDYERGGSGDPPPLP